MSGSNQPDANPPDATAVAEAAATMAATGEAFEAAPQARPTEADPLLAQTIELGRPPPDTTIELDERGRT
jgi:hypothetical protein